MDVLTIFKYSSQIYYALGLLSLITVSAKLLLQNLYRDIIKTGTHRYAIYTRELEKYFKILKQSNGSVVHQFKVVIQGDYIRQRNHICFCRTPTLEAG